MRFEFATATRIVFGEGAFQEVAPAVKAMGRRALLVTNLGAASGRWPQTVLKVRRRAHRRSGPPRHANWPATNGATWWSSFGGGSAIDTGKAIAAHARQRRRSARLPRGGRPRAAAAASRRRRSSPFRPPPAPARKSRATRCSPPRAPRQGQPAQPADAAAAGGGRSGTDAGSAARAHRQHRARRADAADRAVRLDPRESDDGCFTPGRHAAGRARAAFAPIRDGRDRAGPRGHVAGEPVRRPVPGQRGTGRGARLCRARRRAPSMRRTARSARRCCLLRWR